MVKAWRCGALVLAGALGLGCGGGGPDTRGPAARSGEPGPAAIPQGVETTISGTVAVVGSTPLEQVIVRRQGDRQSVELRGGLVSELRSLSGAEVRVWGRVAPGRVLHVWDYDILEIAGRTPAVGRLEAYDWGVAIESGHGRLHIYEPPAELRRQAGQKVWVNLGSANDVVSYGVIVKK